MALLELCTSLSPVATILNCNIAHVFMVVNHLVFQLSQLACASEIALMSRTLVFSCSSFLSAFPAYEPPPDSSGYALPAPLAPFSCKYGSIIDLACPSWPLLIKFDMSSRPYL